MHIIAAWLACMIVLAVLATVDWSVVVWMCFLYGVPTVIFLKLRKQRRIRRRVAAERGGGPALS